MTDERREPVRVPSNEELMATVIPGGGARRSSEVEPVKVMSETSLDKPKLSRDSEAVLRLAARHPGKNQRELFSALGIRSGSTQNRVIRELLDRYAFIRRKRCGRSYGLHITAAGQAYLAESPHRLRGMGGDLHKRWAEKIARDLRRHGFERVQIECPVGPKGKRVDVMASGKQRVGVEIGISSVDQEIRNLTLDLQSGALDKVLMMSPDPELIERVNAHVMKDPYLKTQLKRIAFLVLPKEDVDR